MASLVYDHKKMNLQEIDRCECCALPLADVTHKYPLCVENYELGQLGTGFPLFFDFIKYMNYTLFLLSVIYFIPMAVWTYQAFIVIKPVLSVNDSYVAIYSLGAFLKYGNEKNNRTAIIIQESTNPNYAQNNKTLPFLEF
jgi:hypothetical protein